jgi:hypothetical protein
MVARGDGSVALFFEVSEMNGKHAPPTGDHEGRPYGWADLFVHVHNWCIRVSGLICQKP